MADSSRPSSTGDKATIVDNPKHSTVKDSAGDVKKPAVVVEGKDKDEQGKDNEKDKEVEPVSFVELFRYSTNLELIIDAIALVAAAAAGAAQPLMTLLFGKLVGAFVDFQKIVGAMDAGVQEAADQFPATAGNF
ncbi:hypothetical protein PQX77_019085 [Marasmius sp. AFHP31]|nr:hypothetical protein PQX77_019085 [Marasmius sp. AFHP31]